MKKNTIGTRKSKLTTAEVKLALFEAFHHEEYPVSATTVDFAKLDAYLKQNNVPKPDYNKFRQLLDESKKLKSPSNKLGQLASSVAKKEELALAARSGAGKISETTRKKMDAVWEKRSQRKPKA